MLKFCHLYSLSSAFFIYRDLVAGTSSLEIVRHLSFLALAAGLAAGCGFWLADQALTYHASAKLLN